MNFFKYINLRDYPDLVSDAAKWFHKKWDVPMNEYLKVMNSYIKHETDYGWYLCMLNNQIIAGVGVIENDFHDRKDITPNICAL